MPAPRHVVSDPTGFPMVWVQELAAYVHWLPVTKIQFEAFLCAAPDGHFDAAWYDAVLDLNPRVTPRHVASHNYWRALMTAVQPAEAQRFAAWCGDGFRLPTDDEWTTVYGATCGEPELDLAVSDLLVGRDGRTRELVERLDRAGRATASSMGGVADRAGQMLLRYGAMEWVRATAWPSDWSTRGEPSPAFCGNLELPERPATGLAAEMESARLPAAGFRLLWLPSLERTSQTSDRST